ncbi:RAP domain-containing protein [Endozoicomonas acroporae]|uniref:RAP domain-containing protein n=1 Tax=Endozoicomonas acroporae TaxID=1701104 RepID=UPI000C770B4B|nr:RAP domain-containing protein [Endozoicomonas acroporae]
MDRSSSGISGKYARPGNDYNQPDDSAAASRRGRYRQCTVRHRDNPPRSTPWPNEFYHSLGPCPSQNLLRRSINTTNDFNALIKQEIMADLVSKSDRLGHCYDGRHHGQYASSIKKYTSASKRPLNRVEQSQLIRCLQNFTATRHWNWRSLTTTLHSLTSAGVFTPHKPMDEVVKRTQAALLSTLLDAIIFKCNKKPPARDIDAQGVANLLWAMAKLLDNGQERTPEFRVAVATLLPHVNAQKKQFIPQGIANLLWAMAKLVDNGQERTPEFKEAVAALLLHVNAQKAHFKAQGIANLLWAMAKLADNGQERTPELNEAVVALLPRVKVQKDQFIPQHIANLLWAMAKLVDNGQERTPEFKAAVATLLPHVNAQKALFNPQEITNLLWAMAKLVDNGQEQTPGLIKAVAALLPFVNAEKDNFTPQGIATLLLAMAKLNQLIELHVVTATFESLVYRISDNPQLSQKDILMSLWGVMVLCARLALDSNANKNNVLEKHMDDLFTRLKNTYPDNEEDHSILAMAASWLGRPCPVVPHYQTNVSKLQADFRAQLQSCIPSLQIEEEKSLNSLPPVDLLLPEHNMVIEIQGPSHYVSGDFKTRNGSTLLKIALLQKSGFEVIEIPTKSLWNPDSINRYIDQIKTRVDIPPQGHGSVSHKIGWADEANATADKGGNPQITVT